jgi:uncharacterized protein
VPAYFFDSSALVKGYVNETGSAWVSSLLGPPSGNDLFLARITGVEVISAICRRERTGNIASAVVAAAINQFRQEFAIRFDFVPVSSRLIDQAMLLAENHGLRGYDAVQLAAALSVQRRRQHNREPRLTFVSADANLNGAAAIEGLPIDDPNAHP